MTEKKYQNMATSSQFRSPNFQSFRTFQEQSVATSEAPHAMELQADGRYLLKTLNYLNNYIFRKIARLCNDIIH